MGCEASVLSPRVFGLFRREKPVEHHCAECTKAFAPGRDEAGVPAGAVRIELVRDEHGRTLEEGAGGTTALPSVLVCKHPCLSEIFRLKPAPIALNESYTKQLPSGAVVRWRYFANQYHVAGAVCRSALPNASARLSEEWEALRAHHVPSPLPVSA